MVVSAKPGAGAGCRWRREARGLYSAAGGSGGGGGSWGQGETKHVEDKSKTQSAVRGGV